MSWRNAALCWLLRRFFRPATCVPRIDVGRARRYADMRLYVPRLPAGYRLRRVADASPSGEWIEPADAERRAGVERAILYLHGGGYYYGSPRTHRSIGCALAAGVPARVFMAAYRLAPEHPFPAALDDAVSACRRLYADGIPPASLVIAGDSAGGGLALATVLALRDGGDRLPAGVVLFSPWTDLAATGATLVDNDDRDPMFCGASIGRVAALYLGGADAYAPLASPLYADLTGLPPLFIQAADTEVLLADSTRLVDRAHAAGVDVRFAAWPKVPHAWQIYWPLLPEARAALGEAAAFVRMVAR